MNFVIVALRELWADNGLLAGRSQRCWDRVNPTDVGRSSTGPSWFALLTGPAFPGSTVYCRSGERMPSPLSTVVRVGYRNSDSAAVHAIRALRTATVPYRRSLPGRRLYSNRRPHGPSAPGVPTRRPLPVSARVVRTRRPPPVSARVVRPQCPHGPSAPGVRMGRQLTVDPETVRTHAASGVGITRPASR